MKLAVFLPNWIGDACMAIPALRAIRSGMGRNCEILGVARPGPAALMQGQPWLDAMFVYSSHAKHPNWNRRRLVSELRTQHIDAAVLFPNSLASAAIATLSRIPRRIGYARDGRAWLLTDRIKVPSHLGRYTPTPAIDYYLKLAEHLGCPSVDRHMSFQIGDEHLSQTRRLWKAIGFRSEAPTIVINSNAASSPARLWPNERVLKLAQKLVRHPDVQVLFHCGPHERSIADATAVQANHPRIKSMGVFQDLPLGLSLAVLSEASLVISTDSGARAMAVAMNRPVISIFGPTKPEWTTTYNLPETILRAVDPCLTCRKTSPYKTESGEKCTCMQQISVEQVYTAALEKLRHREAYPLRAAS